MVYRPRYISKDRLILVEPSQANAATCALPMTTATRGKTHEMKEGRKKASEETFPNMQLAVVARGLFSWLAIAPATATACALLQQSAAKMSSFSATSKGKHLLVRTYRHNHHAQH